MRGINYAKESLDPARYVVSLARVSLHSPPEHYRLRNHDLLTSLDVLSTGSYLRLPACIKVSSNLAPPPSGFNVCITENNCSSGPFNRHGSNQNAFIHGKPHSISFARRGIHTSGDDAASYRYVIGGEPILRLTSVQLMDGSILRLLNCSKSLSVFGGPRRMMDGFLWASNFCLTYEEI